MTKDEIERGLSSLRDRTIQELTVSKEDFSEFRDVLVIQDDFKHFRGTAKRNGHVKYEYLDEPRS